MKLNTIAANINDMDCVLEKILHLTGAHPFLEFNLDAKGRLVRVSIMEFGNVTLELPVQSTQDTTTTYKVMPGLYESMIQLPSGLVVQPLNERLWMMIPYYCVKWVLTKLTRKRPRFVLS
jgi:hypothetical protein